MCDLHSAGNAVHVLFTENKKELEKSKKKTNSEKQPAAIYNSNEIGGSIIECWMAIKLFLMMHENLPIPPIIG